MTVCVSVCMYVCVCVCVCTHVCAYAWKRDSGKARIMTTTVIVFTSTFSADFYWQFCSKKKISNICPWLSMQQFRYQWKEVAAVDYMAAQLQQCKWKCPWKQVNPARSGKQRFPKSLQTSSKESNVRGPPWLIEYRLKKNMENLIPVNYETVKT